jgi:hypothetical protein
VRTVVIIDNGAVQIDLVPETDADKAALKMIPEGTLLRVGQGRGYAQTQGGYLRPFGDDGSVNFTFVTSVPRPGYVYQEVAEEPSA